MVHRRSRACCDRCLSPAERETAITRDVFTAEIQRTVNEVGPLVRDLK